MPHFLAITTFVGLLFFQSATVFAQQLSEEVSAEDRVKIARFVAEYDARVGLGTRETLSQSSELVDLNQDGIFEAFVYLDSATDCGSLGCARIILDLSEPEARDMGRFIGMEFVAIATTTQGWHDIRLDGLRMVKSGTGYVPAWRLTDSSFEAYGQRLLGDAGYDVGPIDGQIGNRTRSAIRQFEIDNGLPARGEMNRALIAALETHRLSTMQSGSAQTAVPATQETESSPSSGASASANLKLRGDERSCAELRAGFSSNSGDIVTNMWADTADGRVFGYSDGDDEIRIERTDNLIGHMAGLGDDFLLVDGPQSGIGIDSGPGADTIVVCSIGDTQTVMMVGLSDTDADTIVLKEDVFADPPANDPMLMIGGFSAVEDTLLIRIMEGTEVEYEDVTIRIGAVRIFLIPDHNSSFDSDRSPITIVTSGGLEIIPPDRYWKQNAGAVAEMQSRPALTQMTDVQTLSREPFLQAIPFHDCSVLGDGSDLIEPAEIQRSILGSAGVILTDETDRVFVDGTQNVGYVEGKLGDDLIQIFEGPAELDVIAGGGADVVVLCSVSDANRRVVLNTGDGGAGADIDGDTVILYGDIFRNAPAGHIRDIGIYGFAPSNDRLFIEVSDLNDVSIVDNFKNSLKLSVGQASITVFNAELLTASEFKLGSVILVPPGVLQAASENGIPAAVTTSAPNEASDCGQATGLSDYEPTIIKERWGADQHYLTHASDTVLVRKQGRTIAMYAGQGNDRIAFEQLADDLRLDAGSGSDRIDLCSMSGLTTNLHVGTDRDIDTVFIHRKVFEGIPEGMTRTIFVEGLEPTQDRVVVDVPSGLSGWQGNSREKLANIGQVRLYLLGSNTRTPDYTFDLIEVAAPEAMK